MDFAGADIPRDILEKDDLEDIMSNFSFPWEAKDQNVPSKQNCIQSLTFSVTPDKTNYTPSTAPEVLNTVKEDSKNNATQDSPRNILKKGKNRRSSARLKAHEIMKSFDTIQESDCSSMIQDTPIGNVNRSSEAEKENECSKSSNRMRKNRRKFSRYSAKLNFTEEAQFETCSYQSDQPLIEAVYTDGQELKTYSHNVEDFQNFDDFFERSSPATNSSSVDLKRDDCMASPSNSNLNKKEEAEYLRLSPKNSPKVAKIKPKRRQSMRIKAIQNFALMQNIGGLLENTEHVIPGAETEETLVGIRKNVKAGEEPKRRATRSNRRRSSRLSGMSIPLLELDCKGIPKLCKEIARESVSEVEQVAMEIGETSPTIGGRLVSISKFNDQENNISEQNLSNRSSASPLSSYPAAAVGNHDKENGSEVEEMKLSKESSPCNMQNTSFSVTTETSAQDVLESLQENTPPSPTLDSPAFAFDEPRYFEPSPNFGVGDAYGDSPYDPADPLMPMVTPPTPTSWQNTPSSHLANAFEKVSLADDKTLASPRCFDALTPPSSSSPLQGYEKILNRTVETISPLKSPFITPSELQNKRSQDFNDVQIIQNVEMDTHNPGNKELHISNFAQTFARCSPEEDISAIMTPPFIEQPHRLSELFEAIVSPESDSDFVTPMKGDENETDSDFVTPMKGDENESDSGSLSNKTQFNMPPQFIPTPFPLLGCEADTLPRLAPNPINSFPAEVQNSEAGLVMFECSESQESLGHVESLHECSHRVGNVEEMNTIFVQQQLRIESNELSDINVIKQQQGSKGTRRVSKKRQKLHGYTASIKTTKRVDGISDVEMKDESKLPLEESFESASSSNSIATTRRRRSLRISVHSHKATNMNNSKDSQLANGVDSDNFLDIGETVDSNSQESGDVICSKVKDLYLKRGGCEEVEPVLLETVYEEASNIHRGKEFSKQKFKRQLAFPEKPWRLRKGAKPKAGKGAKKRRLSVKKAPKQDEAVLLARLDSLLETLDSSFDMP